MQADCAGVDSAVPTGPLPARLVAVLSHTFSYTNLTGEHTPQAQCVLFPILVTHTVYLPRSLSVGSFTLALSLRGWYLIEFTRYVRHTQRVTGHAAPAMAWS